jgi:hypothetical protein
MQLGAKRSDDATTQARERNHPGVVIRLRLDRSTFRRILSQRIVNPVLVMVSDVILKQTQKVTFVERNDVV